jgi:hypothetical protein
MLRTFFEFGCKRELFDGLKISERKDLCEEYMGKFPVISISLKDISGTSFQGALASMKYMIAAEARRSPFLEQSDRLSDTDKRFYRALVDVNEFGDLTMSNAALENSLSELSRLLEKHYGTKVILLIDEYDVPLDQAFQAGYYDEMVTLIRNFFSKALKTNQSL